MAMVQGRFINNFFKEVKNVRPTERHMNPKAEQECELPLNYLNHVMAYCG